MLHDYKGVPRPQGTCQTIRVYVPLLCTLVRIRYIIPTVARCFRRGPVGWDPYKRSGDRRTC